MTFRVGQKVVCVDDSGHEYLPYVAPRLFRGKIYTIAMARINDYGTQSVGLVECNNGEWGYYSNRFRPLVERKTDIEWAHRIDRKVFGGADA